MTLLAFLNFQAAPDESWSFLIWIAVAAVSLVLPQIRLFFIDSKLQNIFNKMEEILGELRKAPRT